MGTTAGGEIDAGLSKRRRRRKSYDESVDEPAKLIELESVDVEAEARRRHLGLRAEVEHRPVPHQALAGRQAVARGVGGAIRDCGGRGGIHGNDNGFRVNSSGRFDFFNIGVRERGNFLGLPVIGDGELVGAQAFDGDQ